jgi:hypothetical protein
MCYNQDLKSIYFNILGGIIVALLTLGVTKLYSYYKRNIRRKEFVRIFGEDVIDNYNFIFALLNISNPQSDFPLHNPAINNESFKSSALMATSEVRALKYLSEGMGRLVDKFPILNDDSNLLGKLDFSFCSLGGTSAFSRSVMKYENNSFWKTKDNRSFVSLKSNKTYEIDDNFDYAIILKIHPVQFPKRTHIIIIGIGEWGTSGGAWFLANKWREIYKIAKDKEFGVVIRVNHRSDESAKIADKIIR